MEEKRLSQDEKYQFYRLCVGSLNRICITDDKKELLDMIASLNHNVYVLGKDTFLRIDEEEWLANQIKRSMFV